MNISVFRSQGANVSNVNLKVIDVQMVPGERIMRKSNMRQELDPRTIPSGFNTESLGGEGRANGNGN